MNVPPEDDIRARRLEYDQGQEALARFRGALRACQSRPYLERQIPDNKRRQLMEAVRHATTVLQHVGQSSVESLADLAGLLDHTGAKYEDIFLELSDVVELVEVGLRRFRQRHAVDARTTNRSTVTMRLPPESVTEQEVEDEAPTG
ncbi:hypothetical protein [Micromonospora profundi]|uniref:hypothetical protein n=1 Tax=Micromonospora profundi TaxID=1420889 RepID=UPI0036B11952